MRWLLLPLMLLLALGQALAVNPDEKLDDLALEARAREISQQLRCVVCQNQSIDDSDAPLAKDLRLLVRERVAEGDTNAEVIDYVVARYGEFVLLRPRFEGEGIILWLAPVLLLLVGAGLAFVFLRGHAARPAAPPPLDETELHELMRILNRDDRKPLPPPQDQPAPDFRNVTAPDTGSGSGPSSGD